MNVFAHACVQIFWPKDLTYQRSDHSTHLLAQFFKDARPQWFVLEICFVWLKYSGKCHQDRIEVELRATFDREKEIRAILIVGEMWVKEDKPSK